MRFRALFALLPRARPRQPAPLSRQDLAPEGRSLGAAKDRARGQAEFLVMLREQADLRGARTLPTKTQKSAFVADALSSTAARVQAPLRALLDARGAEYRAYWVANMIWVRGDRNLVEELAAREDVFHVYANPWVALRGPVSSKPSASAPERPTRSSGASRRCTRPKSGRSASRARASSSPAQDTGYQWDHPALKAKYRGWNGSAPTTTTTGTTPSTRAAARAAPTRQAPCDDFGHGTHTMGTMVGDDGGGNKIGVAPGGEVDRVPQHGSGRRHARHLHRVLPVVHRADGPGKPESRSRPRRPTSSTTPGAAHRARAART